MSIPKIHRENATLTVKIRSGFNLWVKNIITTHTSEEIETLDIDLSDCNYIDTEGIIFLYEWQQNGRNLQLKNPPEVFFEMLDILELSDSWQPNIINPNEESL
ncbi:hypothetical protein [Fodinibius sp.]|uniref:hypothetical protein n=1 Tax=Fodinibius sp. TaxID=1872440 RepID=UPI002ACDA089|nr:hypothetical protein [Fodinibius sp.]MDZ7660023.1 hypothetical protein [Fodinibius sp.]